MKKEFLINVFILVLINFLVKPFYLLIVETDVQNTVGTDQYGYYFGLFSFVFLFQFINDPGIQQYNAVTIATENSFSFLEYLLGLKLLLGLVFILTVLTGAYLFDYNTNDFYLILFICLNFILSSFFVIIRSSISAIGKYRVDSFISAIDKVLLILILSYLLWFSNHNSAFSIWWFVISQSIASFLALIIALFLLVKSSEKIKLRFSKSRTIALLKSCAPFAVLILLMTAYTKIDGVMLSKMLPDRPEETGIYAAGFRFFDAANMVGVLSAGILLPMYSKNIKDKKTIYSLLKTGILSLSFLILSGVAFLMLFSTPILSFVYDEYTPYYDQVFYYIIIALIPLIIVHVFGPILLAIKKLNNINKIFFLALILNISLNYVLIPSQAAIGAAKATLITQFLVAFCLIPISLLELRKFYKEEEPK